MKIKSFFAAAVCVCMSLNAFALIGAQQKIADNSGEYVYYCDKTFTRESYVGFLYYDEGTIQIRYYAPKNEELPSRTVELIISLDTSKPYIEMTGEKFISEPKQDDAEIINYLHDLIYEFAGRRGKISDIPLFDYSASKANVCDEGLRSKEIFPQFGGDVTIIYDNLVPIFNIKKISDFAGKDVFTVVTTGRIGSAEDRSFSSFIPSSEITDPREASVIKKGKKQILSMEAIDDEEKNFSQSVTASDDWQEAMDGMWLLGQSAVLNLNGFFLKQESLLLEQNVLLRMFLESQSHFYTDWQNYTIRMDKGNLKINGIRYNIENKNVLRDIRVFAKITSEIYGTCVLSCFEKSYLANRGYFDAIVKSYSVKK